MSKSRDEARTPLLDFTASTGSVGSAGGGNYGAIGDGSYDSQSSGNSRYISVGVREGNTALGVSSIEENYVPAKRRQLNKPPASLSVVGLTYTVKERTGHWWNGNFLRQARFKRVLDNLCMTFNPGELTALVGTSGSGKTSLLDVISGRADGEVKGVVSYRHEQCTRAMMKRKSSYVIQADRLLPTLTVRETLTYMALLKLPGHQSLREIDKKVQSVIEQMGLSHVSDSRIGGAMIRGVSGGERRRITIGVQLLRDPDILLLDEPTTGLDSFTARHLVATLAGLAHNGDKLVIMSVHQPRSDIFNMLDRIGILTSGQLAYLGPPTMMVDYFTSIGHPCPPNQNPCDVYMDITSVDRRTVERERESTKLAQKLCNAFSQSTLQNGIVDSITSGLNYHYEDDGSNILYKHDESPSWFRVFQCLLERMNVHMWRERSAVVGRIFELPMFVPFIIMFIGHVGNSFSGIQDRLGILYQATQAPAFMGLTNAVARFPSLREVFYRETQDGLYSSPTFLAVYFCHVLPFNIITSALFASILYWIVGLQSDLVVFGQFVLVCFMLTQFGEMMAVTMLGIFRSAQLASDTTSLIFSASAFLSSGLLRSITNMPEILKWLGYIAIHKYTTEIVVSNEFHGLVFDCPGQEPCTETGDSYLDTFYPNALDHRDRNFSLLGGYTIGILIFACMMYKARGSPTLH